VVQAQAPAASGIVAEGLRTAERLAGVSAAAMRDTVEFGVRTAYTVVDEYMRRGREAAERYSTLSPWRNEMANQPPNSFNQGPTAWGPLWPMVAPWMQMMQTWATTMSAGMPMWNAVGMRPNVSVRVRSAAPVEVSPTLLPGADAVMLAADPLQADGGGGLPPDAVIISSSPGQVVVSVTIPADQKPGTYRGVVRQAQTGAAGMPLGQLVVTIEGS
jgi:hypothetical protein